MEFRTLPLTNLSLKAAADLFNRSFEGYFIPVQFTEETLKAFTQRDGIDFAASRILFAHEKPAGLALIARREATSRLAGFGIIREIRGQGAGTWFAQTLLDEARQRSEKQMFLEVITQNEYAIQLYEKYGFTMLRKLLGFRVENPVGSPNADLKPCDQTLVLNMIRAHGLPNLPWQVDAETLSRVESLGYRLGEACMLTSDPGAEQVSIRSLIVPAEVRGQGQGARLLKALFAKYPGRIWQIPAIFPEEMVSTFEKAEMHPEKLSQWQMVCRL